MPSVNSARYRYTNRKVVSERFVKPMEGNYCDKITERIEKENIIYSTAYGNYLPAKSPPPGDAKYSAGICENIA